MYLAKSLYQANRKFAKHLQTLNRRGHVLSSNKLDTAFINSFKCDLNKIHYNLLHSSACKTAITRPPENEPKEKFNSPLPQKSGRSKVRSILELMRWHKPTGTILALMPSLWSVGLATSDAYLTPDLKTIAIFTAGAVAARGMGCTLNDILDRKFDRLVERTKMRPIACGDISTKEALFYLAIQSTIGLYILCLNNTEVIKLGLLSGIMISTYPLFKRFTYWPQVMLALTMNWGVLMGFAAVKGTICISDLSALLSIYSGSIFWTMYYDTIYAHQDKADDMFIGVKSSALVLGDKTKFFLNQMIGGMSLSLGMAGYLTGQLWPYYLSIALTSLYQVNQVRRLNLDNMDECWTIFDHQKYIGIFILCGVLASVAMRHKIAKEKTLEVSDK